MPKHVSTGYCVLAAGLALALPAALNGCAPQELRPQAHSPAAADALYIAEADLTPPPPPPPQEPAPDEAGIPVPSTVRLDPASANTPDGAPARLADADLPGTQADAYPGLTPRQLEHYAVGRHLGYQEPENSTVE